jgi:UDP-glucose 4-epimerase
VQEVLDAIAAETGTSLRAVGPRRQGDPAILVADAARARVELGFTPTLSDLKSIIKSAWGWHSRAHPKKERPRLAGSL